MSDIGQEQVADAKPWAAYTLGRLPDILLAHVEMLWYDLSSIEPGELGREWEPIAAEVEEAREALRILALADRVKPAIHTELHRVLDALIGMEERLPEWVGFLKDLSAEMPANRELHLLGCLSGNLLNGSDGLLAWHRLGDLVGHRQHILLAGAGDARERAAVESARSLMVAETVPCLPAGDNLVKNIANVLAKEPVTSVEAWELRQQLSTIDNELRDHLLDRQAPGYSLVLDQHHLTLHGVKRKVGKLSPNELGCFWVLAECAGQLVERKEIIADGCLQSNEVNLAPIVSRLNGKLKRIWRHGGERLIRGEEAGKGHGSGRGPYRLGLDPAQVRIVLPRPKWMTKRTKAQQADVAASTK
ncbi:MAG: hypothetical protein K2W96_28170 [Gemmataceae bacterium]|nr:hypothetical protein [Gemmataceae bacterium]